MLNRLPEEIQADVFLRLPVRSIQSCRCVCKPMKKLLYNPRFIKDHLINRKSNPSLMLISAAPSEFHLCRSIDYASILSASAAADLASTCGSDQIPTRKRSRGASLASSSALPTCTCEGAIPMDCSFHNDWDCGFTVVGSCNGFICLSLSGGAKFCFWNPSTRDHKTLRLFSFCVALRVAYGFGYDSHLDDYKVVRIVADHQDSCYSQVEVCTIRGLKSSKIQTMNRYMFSAANNLSVWLLHGALHWSAFIKATSSKVIVSFDISTERFVEFVYPEVLNQQSVEVHRGMREYERVCLLEDRLCLIDVHHSSQIDVWLMQEYGVTESWTKQFTIKPSCPIDIHSSKLVWSFTNGEVLIDSGHVKLLYDHKNDSTKLLNIPGMHMTWSQSVSYAESLVSLNLKNSVQVGDPKPAHLLAPHPDRIRPYRDYDMMIIHALMDLEPQHRRGSTIEEIEQRIRLFYDDLPLSHESDVADWLKRMVKSKQAVKADFDTYMFLYTGNLHKKFVSAGVGGGLILPGVGGRLPYMIDYNMMIIHALIDLEQKNPEGSSIEEIIDQIELSYERLPYSHALQVQSWLKIMVGSGQAAKGMLDRYRNLHTCKLYETFRKVGGGPWNVHKRQKRS